MQEHIFWCNVLWQNWRQCHPVFDLATGRAVSKFVWPQRAPLDPDSWYQLPRSLTKRRATWRCLTRFKKLPRRLRQGPSMCIPYHHLSPWFHNVWLILIEHPQQRPNKILTYILVSMAKKAMLRQQRLFSHAWSIRFRHYVWDASEPAKHTWGCPWMMGYAHVRPKVRRHT